MLLGFCQTPVLDREEEVLDLVRQASATASASTSTRNAPPLFLLPELFFGGFDYSRCQEWADRSAELVPRIHSLCREHEVMLAGTFWTGKDPDRRNTFFLFDPDGEKPCPIYDKQHLFPLSGETDRFTPGTQHPPTLNIQGLTTGFAICFELRFPEVFRLLSARDTQLIAISSQWPLSRKQELDILLRARAVENQAFVLSVNVCGSSPYGEMGGSSQLVSPFGDLLLHAGQDPACMCMELDTGLLDKSRARFDSRRSPFYQVVPA